MMKKNQDEEYQYHGNYDQALGEKNSAPGDLCRLFSTTLDAKLNL